MSEEAARDPRSAVEGFLGLVGSARWRETINRSVPGGIEQAIADASTFFERELPAAADWSFSRERAGAIDCPVLSVVGTASGPLFEDGRRHLHQWFDACVDVDLPGITHMLQMEAPNDVADAIGDFLRSVSFATVTKGADRRRDQPA